MKVLCLVAVALSLNAFASGQGNLLEMSQDLWAKLLAGGLTKVGKLDPLRVPVVKVDQSEGETMYRMILRNVEITGLNESMLESIHIARGRLKSNLSELEAGYVSYSDLRDLDAIRYRFHTLVKEPKTQNESFEAIVSATNQEGKFKTEPSMSRIRDSRLERLRQYDPFLLKIQGEQMKEEPAERKQQQQPEYGTFKMEGARVLSKTGTSRVVESMRYPADVQLVYAMNARANARNEQTEDVPDCRGRCQGGRGSYRAGNQGRQGERREEYDESRFAERYEDAQGSASEHVESRVRGQDRRDHYGPSNREEMRHGFREGNRRGSMEDRPGYIDIVYSDGNDNGSMKRFGNAKVDSRGGARVFSLQEVMKSMSENRKFMSYNYTEGESLAKRNEAVRMAMQAKRLEDQIRYAKDFQEMQGYFEEGMQLIYHYGMESQKSQDGKSERGIRRQKRAHQEEEDEEDVMHVILKIRVPLLRIKSDYQLMGRVGKEVLRGNGQFNANFTELVGDFTIELKKASDNQMIVRAARSKLVAKEQNVTLQGMDEKGPVSSILSNGLMAAEAVAAMLADDLATKALNDKTADAMIYRMYKNLPAK